MKRLISFSPQVFGFFMLAVVALSLMGCATARIDWDSRVGSYTYDQAVLDMGPPDRSESLTDGTKVAEWMTARGYARGTMTSFGGHYYGHTSVNYYSEQPSPDHLIRLTFAKGGTLRSWRKVLK